jgi:hypothetical protein
MFGKDPDLYDNAAEELEDDAQLIKDWHKEALSAYFAT